MFANDKIMTGIKQEGFVTKTGVYEWEEQRKKKIQPYCITQRTKKPRKNG